MRALTTAMCLALVAAGCGSSGGSGASPDVSGGGDAVAENDTGSPNDTSEGPGDEDAPAPGDTGSGEEDAPAPGDTGSGEDDAGADPDATPGPLPWAFLDGCFSDLDLPGAGNMEVVSLEHPSGQVRVRVARFNSFDSFGTSGTTPFDAIRFGIERTDQPGVCVTDVAAIEYTITHHNYEDVATVTAGGETFTLEMLLSYGETSFEIQDRLTIAAAGNVTFGPEDLDDAGCVTIPAGEAGLCKGRAGQ